jgi:hypothetical protein
MKRMTIDHCCRVATVLTLVLSISSAAIVISGCGQKSGSLTAEAKEALDADVEPSERPFFTAARPFAEAIAARDYVRAYGFLSSHAKGRMSPSQFVAPSDDATHKRNEASAVINVSSEQFVRMMSATEGEYGRPAKLAELDVFSTDPIALSGKGAKVEDKLESMFAIGMMPTSIPAGIRKASLRSKLIVELSAQQLTEAAKAYQTSVEKLKKDPDFEPYITLKMVLVEESGALKIGYFEFLPPGLFD